MESDPLGNMHQIPTVTPCAGRCSTTFGDHVCRGCRRFSHEIIRWNGYSIEQQAHIWQRLDRQLDKVLVPLLPHANLNRIEYFLLQKRIRTLPNASLGRKLYNALKVCEKNHHLVVGSGLGISPKQVKPIWRFFEDKILRLAQADYDVAWKRATLIKKNLVEL